MRVPEPLVVAALAAPTAGALDEVLLTGLAPDLLRMSRAPAGAGAVVGELNKLVHRRVDVGLAGPGHSPPRAAEPDVGAAGDDPDLVMVYAGEQLRDARPVGPRGAELG